MVVKASSDPYPIPLDHKMIANSPLNQPFASLLELLLVLFGSLRCDSQVSALHGPLMDDISITQNSIPGAGIQNSLLMRRIKSQSETLGIWLIFVVDKG